jgi:NADH-quinone oxidoreductase subunit C
VTAAPSSGAWPAQVRTAYADALGEAASFEADDTGATFGLVTVDVAAAQWVEALLLARDGLGCSFFDFLSAVDELDDGFRVVCHLAAHRPGGVDHLVVRTLLPHDDPVVASAVGVYAGAAWHERETREMFGVRFTADGEVLDLAPLLLPDEFEGHPLRKDFVLASRVAKPWPGAKEPGESDHSVGAPAGRAPRRRARPPGVPDDWPRARTAELPGGGGAPETSPPDNADDSEARGG